MIPAIQSAFVENALRADARQLALMVKTAMLESSDEHRVYVIDLTTAHLDLHPAGNASTADTPSDSGATPEDGEVAYSFDGSNKLLVPDPEKKNAWTKLPDTSWVFQPGELCPATTIRLVRGGSWVEISFNALTGNVENETAYFP